MTAAARKQLEADIRVAAMKLATDAEICAMLSLIPNDLIPHRQMIDRTRAAAMVSLRYHRMTAQAKKVARKPAGNAE